MRGSFRLWCCGILLASTVAGPLYAQTAGDNPRDAVRREEAKKIQREIDALDREYKAKKEQLDAKLRLITQKGRFESEVHKAGLDKPEKPTPPKINRCEDIQRLFIRADSLDNYLYEPVSAAKAKGASVSYTSDRLAGTTTLSVNGMVSYVMARDLCPEGHGSFVSGWAVAPFASGNGDYTNPRPKKEQSNAKVGIEAQVEIARGLPFLNDFPLRQVFTVAPYYQTDFRDQARVVGVNGYWDAYDSRVHLGGTFSNNPYLIWFTQLRGELDVKDVSNPGVTGLSATSYNWVGGTARATFLLWPSTEDVREFIRNRISLIGSYDAFHDTRSGIDAWKYTLTAKYNLNAEGYSSVAYEYTKGLDKDTLVNTNKHMIKLLYAQ